MRYSAARGGRTAKPHRPKHTTPKLWLAIYALLATAWAPAGLAQTPQAAAPLTPADLVILNGRVWTGIPDAKEQQAIAVAGMRIVTVGSNADAQVRVGPQTQVIDAQGRRVIPGITDCHTHFLEGGLGLFRLDLRPARNKAEFRDMVAAGVARMSPGAWLLGGQWSVDSWKDPNPPHREWIDDLTPGTPVFLERMDGHQALVNSVALKHARIDRNGPPDPPGGEIVRDPATGEPTGILKDEAMALVARKIPPPSETEHAQALAAAMRHANSFGVTGIHDMSAPSHLPVFAKFHEAGALTVRIVVYLSVDDWTANIETVRGLHPADDWLGVVGFKNFMDGSLGSRTAYMREPYADAAPDARYPRGLLMAIADPPEKLGRHVRAVVTAGFQPTVHAIGDEANRLLLNIYGSLPEAERAETRPRIEHAQHLRPEDVPRFGKLGVVASMQPFHKADDGRYAEKALGKDRCATSYAFRSLMDSGATVCFGSDWPVVTLSPFAGMASAVGAFTLDDRIWFPQQSISREEALRAYTVTPAVAARREKELGTLEPGKLADIAILLDDPLHSTPKAMLDIRATHTIVGGRLVWQLPLPASAGPSGARQ
ncbi:MAG: amidohydrolase family protein [Phycisphaerae bacterium]|nr:amidohydrolase family protein [Phycisphaerae bacterium]